TPRANSTPGHRGRACRNWPPRRSNSRRSILYPVRNHAKGGPQAALRAVWGRAQSGRLASAQAASATAPISGSHWRHAAGIVGLATWMKTCGLGADGLRRGCNPARLGKWSPLRRLQSAHEATMLSQLDSPPFERGITWSTVRLEREPQYWHVQPSRANTAQRVILRRCVSRGTLT